MSPQPYRSFTPLRPPVAVTKPDPEALLREKIWTDGFCLALAVQSCAACFGLGKRTARDKSAPCNCVYRTIYRALYGKFQQCTSKEKYVSRVSLEANPGRSRRQTWGLKNEEFMADFVSLARRVLTPVQHDIFRFHVLLDADWKLSCRRLKLDRGEFFHEVYRMQQRLGRAAAEMAPYRLFPINEYMTAGCRTPGFELPCTDALLKRAVREDA